METKVYIACGYHKRSKDEVQAFWEEVTKTLNSMGPPTKDASAWKKVWIDLKCYINRKLTANKKEMTSTLGGQCRLQRISPIEEKVIQLTGLVTNTSGIRAAVDFRVCCEIQEDTLASEMDISAMDISSRMEDSIDKALTSKRRQQIPMECTSFLLKEQINSQKEFYNDMNIFHEAIQKKYDEQKLQILQRG